MALRSIKFELNPQEKHLVIRALGLLAVFTLILTAASDLTATIRAGTLFVPVDNGLFQRMVVVADQVVQLRAERPKTIAVDAACTNFGLRAPVETDRFLVGVAPARMDRLVRCLATTPISREMRQRAIWRLSGQLPDERRAVKGLPPTSGAQERDKCVKLTKLKPSQCVRILKVGDAHPDILRAVHRCMAGPRL